MVKKFSEIREHLLRKPAVRAAYEDLAPEYERERKKFEPRPVQGDKQHSASSHAGGDL